MRLGPLPDSWPEERRRRYAALALLLVAACGYRPLYGGRDNATEPRFSVALSRSIVADAVAADEVLSGARDELSRMGMLASGRSYPRIEIEVTRIDETADAISAPMDAPIARTMRISASARAWIVSQPGESPETDTADMRAFVDIAPSTDPATEAFRRANASRAAARRLGTRLVLRLLGRPVASE